MSTPTMRARSGLGVESGDGFRASALPIVRADSRYLAASTARSVAHANSVIISALRNGAMSARNGDTSGLTYADGWAAAATLAELTSFDVTKPSG
jgi:hypothetical protein